MAERLGLDEPTIRRLETRGYLARLTLAESQIHASLYHAHLAHLRSQAKGQATKARR